MLAARIMENKELLEYGGDDTEQMKMINAVVHMSSTLYLKR